MPVDWYLRHRTKKIIEERAVVKKIFNYYDKDEQQREMKIEKNIPIPNTIIWNVFTEVAQEMEIGDSVEFQHHIYADRLCRALIKLKRKYKRRRMPGTNIWRVWRIE